MFDKKDIIKNQERLDLEMRMLMGRSLCKFKKKNYRTALKRAFEFYNKSN
jgi:hypothetical protein